MQWRGFGVLILIGSGICCFGCKKEKDIEMQMQTGMVMTQVFWDYKHQLSQPHPPFFHSLSLSLYNSNPLFSSSSSFSLLFFPRSHRSLRSFNLDGRFLLMISLPELFDRSFPRCVFQCSTHAVVYI